uniref:Dynactin 3 (p22) n=1 Tax=Oryzias latipes TaxID=8090 RepID=A0A3P9L2F3_ORYLA
MLSFSRLSPENDNDLPKKQRPLATRMNIHCLRHHCATLLANTEYGACCACFFALNMDKTLETESLEMRIEALENQINGERRIRSGKQVKCAESLARIQSALTNTANKRERVKILHKKIEDLMKYLDPQFTDHITVPDTIKLEFILAEEDSLLSQAALLEQVSSLQPLLDSTYIRDVPEHATKLHRLSQIHIKEQDQTEAQSQEVKKLFEEYNKMMFLLSKQFTQWDESLRTMEEGKGIRPVE